MSESKEVKQVSEGIIGTPMQGEVNKEESQNVEKGIVCDEQADNKNYRTKKKKHTKLLIILLSVVAIIVVSIVTAYCINGIDGVRQLGDFITGQILGMKWLNTLIGYVISLIAGEEFLTGSIGGAIQFFIYDTLKILILLCVLIYLVSYIQSYFPPERTKKILGRHHGIGANIIGALLGTLTPFCSCSSIPIFIGFTRAGISSGVTFSFLISSPLVDLGALILLTSVFGFPIAITYVIVGLLLAVIGGTIIDKTGLGNYVQDFVKAGNNVDIEAQSMTKKDRLKYAGEQVLATLKKVWLYILIGVGIGATIHNFIPDEWIQAILGQDKWYSVLVASVVGVPMYADIFGTIPVAEALFLKGVGVGTILAFMMSVTALSLPSLIMLSKAIKPRLLVAFTVIIVIGIILIGYVFNALGFMFI